MEKCYHLHPCLEISSTSYILSKLLSNLSEKKKATTFREYSCFLPFLCQECIKVLHFVKLLYSEIEWKAVTSKKKKEELLGLYLFVVKNKDTSVYFTG